MINNVKSENSWYVFGAKNLLICLLLTVVILFLMSVVAVFASLQAAAVSLMVSVITYLCVGICGFRCARRSGSNGLLMGAVSGLSYAVVLYLVGAIVFGELSFNTSILLTMLICVLCGGVGGVIGVNTKSKKRR